jgi:two-component system, NarL family, nitrate/nitrite sensor histidine kinase NarX
MRRDWNLSTKLGAVGVALMVVALASIGLTLWVTWQLEGGAAAVNEGGRLRMQVWRLAQTLPTADQRSTQALAAEFDRSIALLRDGDPARPLFVPSDELSQSAFAQVQQRWTILQAAWTKSDVPAPAVVAAQAGGFVERIDHFVSAIELQLARWTAVLTIFQFAMLALVIASTVTLFYTAYLLVFNPLARLQAGLARVQQGELSARVEISSGDEFGALAAAFNSMAATLQNLYQNLELKVQEKTLRLQSESARLSALYDAAAFVARADSLDALAKGFAQQLRRVAQADASAIRWADELNQRYVMLASDCLAQDVIDAEHCIRTSNCFCGQPQHTAATRVIPIRAQGASGLLGHCERAGYESVISVPLRLQERIVGELNLFYRAVTALSQDDRVLLETLASHLAGAIEGLRAGALERESVIAQERSHLARELHDSIAQSLAFLKIQAGLLRGALERGSEAQADRALDELDAGIHESLSDVRELLVHFRTRTNTEDIAPALRTTLQKFEHQTGLSTHLSFCGDGLPLAADVQVQVLHVVQEALSNVRKHAKASEVWVEVERAPQWRVQVRDNGQGFATDHAATGEMHVGLRIMQERAQRIGARVEVTSSAGSGTSVVLSMPPAQRIAA